MLLLSGSKRAVFSTGDWTRELTVCSKTGMNGKNGITDTQISSHGYATPISMVTFVVSCVKKTHHYMLNAIGKKRLTSAVCIPNVGEQDI